VKSCTVILSPTSVSGWYVKTAASGLGASDTHRQYEGMKPRKLWVIFGAAKTALFFFFPHSKTTQHAPYILDVLSTLLPHNYNWKPDQPEVPGSYFISSLGTPRGLVSSRGLAWRFYSSPMPTPSDRVRVAAPPNSRHGTSHILQIGKIRTFPSYFYLRTASSELRVGRRRRLLGFVSRGFLNGVIRWGCAAGVKRGSPRSRLSLLCSLDRVAH
jgi:hypothetical protein